MALDYKTELERYRRYYQKIGGTFGQPRQQAYTTAIFSFLAVSLFGWYAIRPTIETILFLRRQIADNRVVSRQMEDKIGKLIDAQAAYQQYSDKLPLLSQALPRDPSVIKIVSGLKNLSNNSASISAVNFSQVPLVAGTATPSAQTVESVKKTSTSVLVPTRKIADIPITIAINGTYPNLITFLNGLVNLRRIISVDAISITRGNENIIGQPGVAQLHAVIKVTAHYLQ